MNRVLTRVGNISLNRKTIYLSLLCCLLFPVLIAYICGFGPLLLIAACLGGSLGWYFLQIWERKMQHSVTQLIHSKMEKIQEPSFSSVIESGSDYEQKIEQLESALENTRIGYEHQINLLQSSVAKSKDEVHQLNLEMDKKLTQMRTAYLEFEDLRKNFLRLEEESGKQSEEAQKSLEHKDALLAEYQKTIAEQRMIIEKKQRYIAKLEGKVRDLMYEIRSLLQLESTAGGITGKGLDTSEQAIIDSFLMPVPKLNTPYDFSMQLKKYMEKVEALTGVDHLGGKSPRFLDLSLESYAIDRRRLFDTFKDETIGVVFIYAPVEKKFLFVNQLVKSITGWSPEKFIKEFSKLVLRGYADWEEAISKIKTLKEAAVRLEILNKAGLPTTFNCYLGAISKGPFAQHVIGILLP